MLTTNLIESELSIAYVLAIAAHSGFATEVKRVDMDSVDITVEAKGALTPKSILHSPKIDIQLKASYSCDLSDPNEIPFDLKLKNYDELRGNYMVPRILVVLSLPTSQNQWLTHSVNDLILRNCAYWMTLKGLPAVTNGTQKRVKIPRTNVFSQIAIKQILERVSEQQPL